MQKRLIDIELGEIKRLRAAANVYTAALQEIASGMRDSEHGLGPLEMQGIASRALLAGQGIQEGRTPAEELPDGH